VLYFNPSSCFQLVLRLFIWNPAVDEYPNCIAITTTACAFISTEFVFIYAFVAFIAALVGN